MNPQIELLIQLQDLDQMIDEVSDAKVAAKEKKLGFVLDGLDRLREAREDLAGKVEPQLLQHYVRIRRREYRAVVPIKKNICLACFMKQPTQFTGSEATEVRTCDHCKRFLYAI